MPINRELLDVLVCPVTKLPVSMLDGEMLDTLNRLVAAGKIHTVDGEVLQAAVTEGLITSNGNMIYRIEEGIPIMLEDQGITADQLDNN